MSENSIQNPDTHAENGPTKPDIHEILKQDHSLGESGREIATSDQELKQIIELLEQDAKKIADAEDENFIHEYYDVIIAFLTALDETIPENAKLEELAKRKCMNSLIRFYIPQLQAYSKKLSAQQSTKRPIMPRSIFFHWRELFTSINFSFGAHLNTSKMTARDNGFAGTPTNETLLQYPPQVEAPIPPQPEPPKKSETVLGMRILMTPANPVSQYPQEVPLNSDSLAKMIDDTKIATSKTQPAIPIVTTPKGIKKDFEDYNDHEKTIADIYDDKFPILPKEWEKTMRHLQQAMAESFTFLKKNFSSADTLPDKNKLKIRQYMENAINKIGDPQFRKRLIHEVYTFTRSVKPVNKREIIELFAIALSKQSEYENPREITTTMKEDICENYQVPLPEQEYLTPDTLVKGYDELDGTEIADMPIEIQRTLSELHSASQEFGLKAIIMSGGTSASRVNIAGMREKDFEILCMQTFEQLTWIENRVKKRPLKPRTWGKSYKQARQFTHKLREILTAQLALMEELLFSKELLIHKDIQSLIKT